MLHIFKVIVQANVFLVTMLGFTICFKKIIRHLQCCFWQWKQAKQLCLVRLFRLMTGHLFMTCFTIWRTIILLVLMKKIGFNVSSKNWNGHNMALKNSIEFYFFENELLSFKYMNESHAKSIQEEIISTAFQISMIRFFVEVV